MPDNGSLRIFTGAVAIVTGAASGIGRALSEALARRGAEVVVADRQHELAEEVAAKIRSSGGTATAAALDVTDFEAVDRLVQQTRDRSGRLDYFFNNAGIGVGGEVREYQIEDWRQVFAVNIQGVANGVQAAYPVMVRQGFGHIVNTASMAGLMPAPWTVSYCAAKHAVVGLTTSLRIEAAPAGVRVSVLCPGVIRTPILEGGKYGRMLPSLLPAIQEHRWERFRPMDPARFAERALRAVARNKAIIVIPAWWKLIWWLNRLSPTLGLALGRQLYLFTKRQVEAAKREQSSTTVQ
jgi:NAD(P)-dependent dehydrogenase (short-subunit alcohol dehydrogenase family)